MKTKLPLGTKTAIARAFEIAIAALEGKEINPIPPARPKMLRRLRRAQETLFRERIIWR